MSTRHIRLLLEKFDRINELSQADRDRIQANALKSLDQMDMQIDKQFKQKPQPEKRPEKRPTLDVDSSTRTKDFTLQQVFNQEKKIVDDLPVTNGFFRYQGEKFHVRQKGFLFGGNPASYGGSLKSYKKLRALIIKSAHKKYKDLKN